MQTVKVNMKSCEIQVSGIPLSKHWHKWEDNGENQEKFMVKQPLQLCFIPRVIPTGYGCFSSVFMRVFADYSEISDSLGQTGSCTAAAQWEHLLPPLHLGFPKYNMKASALPSLPSCHATKVQHPQLTQPNTEGKWDPFGNFHEQSYLGTVQEAPCSATTTCSFLLPQTCLSVTIFVSIAAVWWMKSFSINTANFISTATYKTLGATTLYFYPDFLWC